MPAAERDIESLCLKLLLQQQPVARDLRLIFSALKMITDMERIGDQASDISEIVIYLSSEPYIKQLEHLPLMAEKAIHQPCHADRPRRLRTLRQQCRRDPHGQPRPATGSAGRMGDRHR